MHRIFFMWLGLGIPLAAQTSSVTGEPNARMMQKLGKAGKRLIGVLDQATRAECWEATKFNAGGEESVGSAQVEGAPTILTPDQLRRLKILLRSPGTYLNQDSKGIKEGVAVRLTAPDGSRAEWSWCLQKGNINFLLVDADGKTISRGSPGGFRNDRHHPIRPFSRELLGGAKAPDLVIRTPAQAEAEEQARQARLLENLPIAEGAKVNVLADGFKFLEGPARAPNGDLYFVDKNANRILHWQVDKQAIREVTADSKAANGMQFDARGRLIACQGTTRSVVAFDPRSGEVTEVLAEKFDGKVFNNPNDLWIHPGGGIYFTDPAYKNTGKNELDTKQAYYIAPDKSVIRVTDSFHTPNGIVGTPDGKTLFITDRRLGRTWQFKVQADGQLADQRIFCKVGADGITLDSKGNLYTTPMAKEIRVFDPEGGELGRIQLPGLPSNLCFAGADGKTLFITTHKALCSIQMTVSGQ